MTYKRVILGTEHVMTSIYMVTFFQQKLEDYEKDMKMLLDQCEQSVNRTEEQSRKMHQILASIKPNA